MTPIAPQLRPYQEELARAVGNAYRRKLRCPLVVLSTGGGKTVIFSFITHNASAKGNAVLLAAHRREIIQQICMSLAKFGVVHQVIAPPSTARKIQAAQFRAFGRSFVKGGALVMVGSVQTIVGRTAIIDSTMARAKGERPDAKLMVIMDEGHHVVADTQWGKVMDHCIEQHKAMGLIVTASPERLDGVGLGRGHGGYADELIQGPSMSWLMEHGYLSPYRCFTVLNQIDTTGVHTRMGDFAISELAEKADKPSVTGDAITEYRKHADGFRTVAFCVSVEHSKHLAEQLTAAGIPAAHIDGGTEDDERDAAIKAFADGRIQVLTNVDLVSEGFDLASIAQKDVTIDCVMDLAPTMSLVKFLQRGGRMLRPAEGKVGVYLDLAGNFARHGMLQEDREWSLEGRKRKKGKAAANDNEPGVDRVSTCPKCFSVHLPAPACPECGHVYPTKARRVEQVDGELQELTSEQLDAMRRQRRAMQGKQQTVEELMHTMGMSRARAQIVLQSRQAKARQIDAIMDGLERIKQQTGQGPHQVLGVTLGDIRRAKPKQLAEMLEALSKIGASEFRVQRVG